MSLYRKVLIPTIAGWMVAGAAQAQLFPTWESHITLTQQDMEIIHNAVTNQIHGKPVGTAASWTNSASQKFGVYQARQETGPQRPAMRGHRLYGPVGRAGLYRALPSHQLSPAGRELETRLGPGS